MCSFITELLNILPIQKFIREEGTVLAAYDCGRVFSKRFNFPLRGKAIS